MFKVSVFLAFAALIPALYGELIHSGALEFVTLIVLCYFSPSLRLLDSSSHRLRLMGSSLGINICHPLWWTKCAQRVNEHASPSTEMEIRSHGQYYFPCSYCYWCQRTIFSSTCIWHHHSWQGYCHPFLPPWTLPYQTNSRILFRKHAIQKGRYESRPQMLNVLMHSKLYLIQ